MVFGNIRTIPFYAGLIKAIFPGQYIIYKGIMGRAQEWPIENVLLVYSIFNRRRTNLWNNIMQLISFPDVAG